MLIFLASVEMHRCRPTQHTDVVGYVGMRGHAKTTRDADAHKHDSFGTPLVECHRATIEARAQAVVDPSLPTLSALSRI